MNEYTEWQKGFAQGFCCAVAGAIEGHGMSTEIKDLWRSNSYSMEEMEALGIEEYDFATLKEHWEELNHNSYKNKI